MDDSTIEPGTTEGQAAEGAIEPTQTAPEGADGQSVEPGTTQADPQESVVFDPGEFKRLTQDLPPELQDQATALQKSLQGAYTKKFQDISANRKKIEAFDAFNTDPQGQLERMAKQYGFSLTREQKAAEGEWEPKTWDDVFNKAKESILADLSPVLNEVQTIKKNSIESQLSEIDPSWQQYESAMMKTIQEHPTLAKDPAMLYRMSVPQEVLESRATQAALLKMKNKVDGGKVAGASTTTQTQKQGLPDKPVTFKEAVAAAQKKLAEKGIRLNS